MLSKKEQDADTIICVSKKNRQSWPVWLPWLEHYLIHGKVEGLISSQGTFPSCRFYPQLGHLQEATDWYFTLVSMLLHLPSFSLKSVFKKLHISVLAYVLTNSGIIDKKLVINGYLWGKELVGGEPFYHVTFYI